MSQLFTNLSEAHKEKLRQGRFELLTRFPFFGLLASHLRFVGTEQVATAAVTLDGKFFIHPEFLELLDKGSNNRTDMLFVQAHEVMHPATGCWSRCPEGGDFNVWNQANDIVINYLLVKSGLSLPNPHVIKPLHSAYRPELAKYDGWNTERVYKDLLQNPLQGLPNQDPGQCPSCGGQHGQHSSGHHQPGQEWYDSSASDMDNEMQGKSQSDNGQSAEENMADWQTRTVSSMTQAAKQAGSLPGELVDFIMQLQKPKVDWREKLRRKASPHLKRKATWQRCSRRTLAANKWTPGKRPDIPLAVAYLDTSGSMCGPGVLERCVSEINGILKASGNPKILLILGDCRIYFSGEVNGLELTKLNMKHGGTDFNVLFDFIEEEEIKPAVLVGFSDLEGPFPETPPSYPVIWGKPKEAHGHGVAPWGDTIDIEIAA